MSEGGGSGERNDARDSRADGGHWRFGDAEFDAAAMRVRVDGASVDLDRSSADLLLCLLRRAPDVVAKEELLRVAWPGRVVTENSLAKAIGRLRSALNDGDSETVRVVHGYGYRLGVPALRLAADVQVPPTAPVADNVVPLRSRRRWWTPVLVGTILAFAAVGMFHVGSQSPAPALADAVDTPQPSPASIAVLPFLDLSEKQDQGYFCDGLADQLLGSLARVPQMRVVGRTSSFAFRGKDLDIPTIGRKLGAQTVLEGSVSKADERMRVTVQLIKSSDGYHLWSQTYDRPVTDMFAMQDEIVREIVNALRVELLPEQQRELVRHATTNAAAYEEYLLGTSVFKDDETAHRRSLAHLERAVTLDPQFIDAWIALADVLGFSGLYADRAEEALAGKRRALDILDHVISIAPNRSDAWLERGIFKYAHWWDWAGAETDLARAAELGGADNPHRLVELARLRAASGRVPDALAVLERVTQLDPQSATAWTVAGYHNLALGRYARAVEVLQQAVRNAPLDEHAHYYLGLVELLQGNAAAAIPHFEDSAHVLRLTGLALAHHTLGDAAASNQDLQLLIARYGHILPYQAAEVYAWRGETERAFEWLELAYSLHDASFMYIEFDPLLRGLHGDPRFAGLLARLKLPPLAAASD